MDTLEQAPSPSPTPVRRDGVEDATGGRSSPQYYTGLSRSLHHSSSDLALNAGPSTPPRVGSSSSLIPRALLEASSDWLPSPVTRELLGATFVRSDQQPLDDDGRPPHKDVESGDSRCASPDLSTPRQRGTDAEVVVVSKTPASASTGRYAAAAASAQPPTLRFDHLDGVRACCSLWVVLEHHASKLPGGDDFAGGHFAWLLSRGNAPVSYFIVLSGFVMSYVYGERHLDTQSRASFLVKRFARVALSYYAALLFAYIVREVKDPYHTPWGSMPLLPQFCETCSPTRALLPTLMMAQAAFNGFGPLNATSWTVSTLVCLWLIYPAVQPCLKRASDTTLLMLSLLSVGAAWLVTLFTAASLVYGPTEEHFWPGYGATGVGYTKLGNLLHLSPVFRLPEFILGLCAGMLCRRGVGGMLFGKDASTSLWGLIASASLIAVPSIAAAVPSDVLPIGVLPDCTPLHALDWGMVGGRCAGRTAFYTAIPAPLFALFMYGSCLALAQHRDRTSRASSSSSSSGSGSGSSSTTTTTTTTTTDTTTSSLSLGPVTDFLSSPVVSGLGRISFQVYLFQEPMVDIFKALAKRAPQVMGDQPLDKLSHGGVLRLPRDSPNQAIYFVFCLLSLWVSAGAFVAYVEDPLMARLARWQKSSATGRSAGFATTVCMVASLLGILYWCIAIVHTAWLCKLSVYDVEYRSGSTMAPSPPPPPHTGWWG